MNALGQHEPNRLKRALASGRSCIGTVVTLSNVAVAEMLSRVGFDWLWFETEHQALGLESLQSMLAATNGSDISTIIRVSWNDKTIIKRTLDLGPDALIIPLINTREEAEYAVRAMKYPPWGERGAGMARAQSYGGQLMEYLQSANDEVMMIAMVEHVDGVANIDEILKVKGVDAVFIGALDLSGSMGILGQTSHPDVEAGVQKVLAACKRAGIPCGAVAMSPEAANDRLEQGFNLIELGMDVVYLRTAAKDALDHVRRPAVAN